MRLAAPRTVRERDAEDGAPHRYQRALLGVQRGDRAGGHEPEWGGRVRRAMEAYDDWFAHSPDLAVLRVLSLFAGPTVEREPRSAPSLDLM